MIRPADWNLKKRIEALVAYFDIFNLSLDRHFIKFYLWGDNSASSGQIESAIAESDLLESADDRIFLKGRKEILYKYNDKLALSQKLLQKSRRWAAIFRYIPFVKLVAVCNYLPLGVVENGSDIDLFIITEKGRIFLARFFTTIFTQLAGIRRHGQKTEGRFCLSFYASEDSLDMTSILIDPNDFYMSFWLAALQPIYGDSAVLDQILKENETWMAGYFDDSIKRFSEGKKADQSGKSGYRYLKEFFLRGKLGNWTEEAFGKLFIGRHFKRIPKLPGTASIEVSEKRMKFHNNDRREYFRRSFLQRLERLNLLQ